MSKSAKSAKTVSSNVQASLECIKDAQRWARSRARPRSAKSGKTNLSNIVQPSPVERPVTSISKTQHPSSSPHTLEERSGILNKKASASFYIQRGSNSSLKEKNAPKNIPKDKEDLYEEVIRLKKIVNTHNEEMKKLKTVVSIKENQIKKKEAETRELETILSQSVLKKSSRPLKNDSFLISELKRKIQKLRITNQSKESQILTIRRNVKLTKFNELETELQIYIDECQRLREMLEEFKNKGNEHLPMSKPTIIQENSIQIQKIMQENEELLKGLQQKDEIITQLKDKFKKQEKKLNLYEKEIEKLKKQLTEAENKRKIAEEKFTKQITKNEIISSINKTKPIIEKTELNLITTELKMHFYSKNASLEEIQKKFFGEFSESDKISIHELERIFKRKTQENIMNHAEFNKLARFLIESRDLQEISYDPLYENNLTEILIRFNELFIEYQVFTKENIKILQESLVSKLKEHMFSLCQTLGSIETEPNFISYDSIDQLFEIMKLEISNQEKEYIIFIMYNSSNNIKKLPYQDLIKTLEELGCKSQSISKIEAKHITEADIPDSVRSNESPENEIQQEEQVIQLAQQCFSKVANYMRESQNTAKSLFKSNITHKIIDGQDMEIINPEDFWAGLEKIGLKDLKPVEIDCLIKVLAVQENSNEISLENFIQILEDYGIMEKDSENMKQFLDFEKLDEISMVLLLALAEYLLQAKVPLYKLFNQVIYTQQVKISSKIQTVELIDSIEFFKIIREIGVELEENEHENLKEFLCLDPKFKDKLYVKKLKKSVEEFAFNEELRSAAKKCYNNIVDDIGGEGRMQDDDGNLTY